MDTLDQFFAGALPALKHAQDRSRAQAIITRWATAWQGPARRLTHTHSNHGEWLHFDQRIGTTWCQVFGFHAAPKHGLSLRGPDTDRARKSHKLRSKPLDAAPLDTLYEAWSAHPEARPAGNAVEMLLSEVPDETWEVCLQEALTSLNIP